MPDQKCKVCDAPTTVGFNIDFKLVPICESCATAIFIQQARFYANRDAKIEQCMDPRTGDGC